MGRQAGPSGCDLARLRQCGPVPAGMASCPAVGPLARPAPLRLFRGSSLRAACDRERRLFRRLRHLGPQFGGGRRVHLQVVGDRHQVDVAGAFAADPFLPHVVQHLLRRALVRRAVTAAAGD